MQQVNALIEAKNRQLEEQAEKLKELDKTKSNFFANISHEFRTPLTLIQGPLEQILSENPGKKLENRARMMLQNSNRLLTLVEQLLELVKFDSGKLKFHALKLNIVPFVRQIVMCFESLATQNKVDLDFQANEDDIGLYFDGEKLERIIINLLSNAFNYTPAHGKITVSIRRIGKGLETTFPQGCVEIMVRDSGAGIPAHQLPHIFDRFYRGESSHKYKRKGTGIGLALTKELVELHHGEINVNSSCREDDTRGTEFILRLPMGKEHLQPGEILKYPMKDAEPAYGTGPGEEPRRDIVGIEEQVNTGNITAGQENKACEEKPIILVVDDNADMRVYIRSALERDYTITEAVNGKEGIRLACEIIPDLVISDVMMPEVDGLEVCAHLKKDMKTCHIPVILLTAKASERSMAEGLETGADDYITKPFNTELLLIRIENLISLRRQLQEKIQQDLLVQPSEIPVSSMDRLFLKELRQVVETFLGDPEFSVAQLAEELHMSVPTLYRKVRAVTGETPNRFVQLYRLNRAAQLLRDDFGNVTQVALAVGFSTSAYFTKCFKEKFQHLPSHFQQAKEKTNKKTE